MGIKFSLDFLSMKFYMHGVQSIANTVNNKSQAGEKFHSLIGFVKILKNLCDFVSILISMA